MDKISIIAIVIAQIVVVICVLVVFLQRRSMKNLIENLTTMIDDATKGTLKSKRPDGSVFSDRSKRLKMHMQRQRHRLFQTIVRTVGQRMCRW